MKEKIIIIPKMKINISYCQKCHNQKNSCSYKNALEQFTNRKFEVEEKCISACGLGKNKYTAEKDGELYIENTLENLITNMEE